ncbi:unnamed protein product, partial [marine sediment metagenome]
RELIRGRIDGRLDFLGHPFQPVYEVKSGMGVARVRVLEDLDRSVWTRHYVDQLLAYCFAEGEPIGILLLDQPGLPNPLEVQLEENLERVQEFITEAEQAVAYSYEEIDIPEFCDDVSVCRRCPHMGKSCSPPMESYGPGTEMIVDEELIQLAEIREQNAAARKLYEDADKQLKKKLRGVENAIMGPFHVRGKWSPKKIWNQRAERVLKRMQSRPTTWRTVNE